jgi:hypothetical protein
MNFQFEKIRIQKEEKEEITLEEIKDYFAEFFPPDQIKKVEDKNWDYLKIHRPSIIRERNLGLRLNALAKDFNLSRETLVQEHGTKILDHLQIFGY